MEAAKEGVIIAAQADRAQDKEHCHACHRRKSAVPPQRPRQGIVEPASLRRYHAEPEHRNHLWKLPQVQAEQTV
ncbi:MAG: hypothetical protein AMJ77_04130 [Dehalococcoidia bacterium SM23_28_2]|nr:MAG: hypothetical protein AMJ77_04130 [Dehalococcoidia bacterium SM23_28_2]